MWIALLLTASPPPAHAHAGADITAVDVERQDLIETGFGVLLDRDDRWQWICHEAVTTDDAIITPRYTISPDDVMLVAVPDLEQARELGHAVYRSVDGCSWDPVQGLDDQAVSNVLFLDADVALASTAELRDGRTGGLFRSHDGGQSFSVVEPVEQGRLFLRFAASDQAVWTASFVPDEPDRAQAHVSTDGGQTWTTHDLDLSAWTETQTTLSVQPLAAHGPDQAWIAASVLTGHVLLHTTDAGQSWQVAHTFDGTLLDGGVGPDGAVWVLEGPTGTWRSTNGSDFARVNAPPAVGIGVFDTYATLATSVAFTGGLTYTLAPDGESAITLAGPDLDGPLDCPADSDQAQVCEALWDNVRIAQPVDTGDTGDSGDDTDADVPDPGCGCASAGSPTLAILPLGLLGGLALLRRRRG